MQPDIEQRMREIAQETIDQNDTSDQFAVAQTPFHTHNGSDSPKVAFKNLSDTPNYYALSAGKAVVVNPTATGLTYGNSSFAGAVISNAASTPFPTGWTVTHNGNGNYTVIHNLGTAVYAPIIQIKDQNRLALVQSVGVNSFGILTYSIGVTYTDTDFYFIVVLP